MKRLLAAILIGVMTLANTAISAGAYNVNQNEIIVVKDVSGTIKQSTLSISSAKAKCVSVYVESNTPVKSIKAVQTLEKRNTSGSYSAVSGASWTKTVYSSNLSFTNKKENLSSGTYRLKTVFTATLSNGTTETTTVYSSTKTIN